MIERANNKQTKHTHTVSRVLKKCFRKLSQNNNNLTYELKSLPQIRLARKQNTKNIYLRTVTQYQEINVSEL